MDRNWLSHDCILSTEYNMNSIKSREYVRGAVKGTCYVGEPNCHRPTVQVVSNASERHSRTLYWQSDAGGWVHGVQHWTPLARSWLCSWPEAPSCLGDCGFFQRLLQRLLFGLWVVAVDPTFRHWWWSLTWRLGHPGPVDGDPRRLWHGAASAWESGAWA